MMNLGRVMHLDLSGKLDVIPWHNPSLCIDYAHFQGNFYTQWSLVFMIITWIPYNILTQKRNIVIFIVLSFAKKYNAYSKISVIIMTEAKQIFWLTFSRRLNDEHNLIWFKWVFVEIPLEHSVEGYLCHTTGNPKSLCSLVVVLKISVVGHLPCKSVQVASPGSYLKFQQGSERDFCPNLHFTFLTAIEDIRVCFW